MNQDRIESKDMRMENDTVDSKAITVKLDVSGAEIRDLKIPDIKKGIC